MRKTLEAVFRPERFPPLAKLDTPQRFERRWAANPHAVLAELAHAAYLDEDLLSHLVSLTGASEVSFFDHLGAQAFFAVWNERAVLSFRGSQPLEAGLGGAGRSDQGPLVELLASVFDPTLQKWLLNDILADLNFLKTAVGEDLKAEAHRGFVAEIDKLWEPVSAALAGLCKPIPVWATGHSLGAAMATIAGLRHPFEGVVTFGEPRVGIGLERIFRAGGHTRYVNGDDPVPLVPPSAGFGFEHHGEVVTIGDSDGRRDFRYDHSIVYYARNLREHQV